MNALIYEFPVNRTWQASYKAAIAEVDSTKIPVLIAEAKKNCRACKTFISEEWREFRGGASSRYRNLRVARPSRHVEVPIDFDAADAQRS
jgi:hypothetical protein